MDDEDLQIEKRGRKPGPHVVPALEFEPERICLLNGVFGETGVGKSFQTELEAKFFTQTTSQKAGRKVLLFDTNGEYLKFPEVSLHHVPDLQLVRVYRINGKKIPHDQMKSAVLHCARKFINGLLIVDDMDKIQTFSQDKDLIKLMMGGRHDGDDLTVCHQSLDMGSTMFWRNVLSLRLHNQVSNYRALAGKAEKYIPILSIAETIVNKQYELGNERFFLTINLRKRKIFGCSNKNSFTNACKKYLVKNKNEIDNAIVELITGGQLKYNERNSQKAWELGFTYALQKLDRYYATGDFVP